MDRLGFIRVAAAVPVVAVADTKTNTHRICSLIESAVEKQVSLLVFPELCVTGCTCGDLFLQNLVLEESENAVEDIAHFCKSLPITVIIGAPFADGAKREQCTVVISNGEIIDVVPSGDNRIYDLDGALVSLQPDESAHIVALPSSDAEDIYSHNTIKSNLCACSSMDACAYIYCNAGFGESTGDNVFSGYSAIFETGSVLAESRPFSTEATLTVADIDLQEIEHKKTLSDAGTNPDEPVILPVAPATDFSKKLYRSTDPTPFIPDENGLETAFEIQATGLATRLSKINCEKAVIGVSGGLDSTLALLCAVNAFDKLGLDRKGIIGITMPGFGTSARTHGNADRLMEELGISIREIDITESCRLHLKEIGHDGTTQDVTFENAQARERTQILMDTANAENAIVIGTGDLSELALGWCTYNGDHMSNYSVNASIPKTLIRAMVLHSAETAYKGTEAGKILKDIVDTPVSPELKGDRSGIIQKTEDIIGPYELHDFFIWYIVGKGFSPEKTIFLAQKAFEGRYGKAEIANCMKTFVKRLFSQQFKRSCSPDGPKVTPVSFSPREGWCIPSDASADIMLENIK